MRIRNAILGHVLSGVFAAPLFASSDTVRDWTVECPTAADCYVSQAVTSGEDRLLAFVRLQPIASGAAVVEVTVPEGTHLPSGVFVATGLAQAHRLDWQRCGRGLCVALSEFSAREVDIWRKMKSASLRYRPAIDAEVVEFRVSLMGLTEALRRAERGAR